MSQSEVLIETLRRYLKVKGITYRDLAEKIGQTEANMKRIFSQRTISLTQLEKMCYAAGTDLFELIRMSSNQVTEIGCFSESQENVLAANPKLFAFLYLILTDVSVEKVIEKYTFTKAEADKFLLKLDKLGIIRLMDGSRFHILISKNIRWLESGPLSRLYRSQISEEFLESSFSNPNERLLFLAAPMSKETLLVLSRRIDKLVSEFLELAEMEKGSKSEKSVPLYLVIAYRPWSFSVVKKYMR
jgi:DNA-binding Xre family transcriptional regulator